MRTIRGLRGRRRAAALVAVIAALATAVAAALAGGGPGVVANASGQSAEGAVVAQTDDSVPARNVTMLGSSPGEATGETWGIGQGNSEGAQAWQLVRYSTASGWTVGPSFENEHGEPLSGFQPAGSPGPTGEPIHDLAGSIASGGAGALLGFVSDKSAPNGQLRMVLVRDPGGSFRETAPVPEALLNTTTESLYSEYRAPMVAALEEGGGRAGALVAPVRIGASGPESGILHWNGSSWTREPIKLPPEAEMPGFRVLSLGAASPTDAWMLAQLSARSGKIALFRRVVSGSEVEWRPVLFAGRAALQIPTRGGEEPFGESGAGSPPSNADDLLTVTAEGVWIDGELAESHRSATMYFKIEGSGPAGQVLASWCTERQYAPSCTHPLSEALPAGPYRSFAWPAATGQEPYGSRVITGFIEGMSLRLTGSEFEPQLALGASTPPNDVGGTRGAAFSSAYEGWLGSFLLPVHLTQHPAPNRVEEYPVPFRKALTAIAPAPGQPIGALSSEALAVGDEGEVARYQPGIGWTPESLYGTNAAISRARLRSVAWPKFNRAYAVGEFGQMWIWRAETGLWEPDPGEPPNFRGNLLGIAFEPGDPVRGFVIGQQGVLMRYGKGWIQLPECANEEVGECIPPAAAGASFTSIAFAGSQAIVVYRKFHPQEAKSAPYYTGGVLVNDGGGWEIDKSAQEALGGYIPWAVGALPDGGAAVSATAGGENQSVPLIIERESFSSAWQPTTQPYPGYEAPGSLALFREDGALRVVASGGLPETKRVEEVEEPPPGFPEALIQPYPLAQGYVIRQTARGWSDEEHDRNPIAQPNADYSRYDMVYNGDPTSAVLVNESGTAGWAVGGVVDPERGEGDTADIGRYPAESGAPPGVGTSQVKTDSKDATLAIGGGAQCAAQCALRAMAGIGPDVWLRSAVALAARTPGVRAFVDTGPRVTTGETSGRPSGIALLGTDYPRELSSYASILSSAKLPTYAVATPTELNGDGSECEFRAAFSSFAAPFGEAPAREGVKPLGNSSESCEGGAAAYYAFEATARAGAASGAGSASSAGAVRVLVLDDSREDDVGSVQLGWIARQLASAKAAGVPAIAVGNAYLQKQIALGSASAAALARVLVQDGASAYFFDSPGENFSIPLRSGGESIPSFGSGTLGYMSVVNAQLEDFRGHAGFLLAQVEVAARNPRNNRAPVTARLIPNIGELALEAKDGVLIRRSHAALFTALARRPRAGGDATGQSTRSEAAQYIPIPANCVGVACANAILPEYEFTSSKPDVGSFVKPNLESSETNAVLLGGNEEKPIADSASGLFCAYNPGKTVITISSGGLSASLTVTVQPGSVRRPCGSTKDEEENLIPNQEPKPGKAHIEGSGPLALTLPAVPPVPAARPPAVPPSPFVPLAALAPIPLRTLVPPPLPAAGEPTPPSGTSPVTQPVAQTEEEDEEATESVSNQATAYRQEEYEPAPLLVVGLLVLAALAGAGGMRRRRKRGEVRVAPATITAIRRERGLARDLRRDRWM
ncbi:MAG TPA: hypothetical protein VMA83_07165 [Solirubrobacteraceae bacterium]|nr:hypothetical protein [Solirubrobacteraceae bacterium]